MLQQYPEGSSAQERDCSRAKTLDLLQSFDSVAKNLCETLHDSGYTS